MTHDGTKELRHIEGKRPAEGGQVCLHATPEVSRQALCGRDASDLPEAGRWAPRYRSSVSYCGRCFEKASALSPGRKWTMGVRRSPQDDDALEWWSWTIRFGRESLLLSMLFWGYRLLILGFAMAMGLAISVTLVSQFIESREWTTLLGLVAVDALVVVVLVLVLHRGSRFALGPHGVTLTDGPRFSRQLPWSEVSSFKIVEGQSASLDRGRIWSLVVVTTDATELGTGLWNTSDVRLRLFADRLNVAFGLP